MFAINQFNSGVFLEKYGEMTDEGSKDKRLEGRVFTSIETMANTVAGANKKDIIEEMLDKAPIKEVVLYLNQCANTGNVRGARQTRKPLFVTKNRQEIGFVFGLRRNGSIMSCLGVNSLSQEISILRLGQTKMKFLSGQ